MDDFLNNSPEELVSLCFHPLLSTSAAKLSEQKDHICYIIQPSLLQVSSVFDLKLLSRFRRITFVRVHFAAIEELSPEYFILVVSTLAIHLNNLSRTDKKKIFLIGISNYT